MDHAEALELLEVAAAEPAGLERLMAGDTTDAAALAGHLAGCAACTAEMTRLRRAAPIVRAAVRTTPPADLRDRTLAFVAAVGRDRSAVRAPAVAIPTGIGAGPGAARSTRRAGWVAAVAAALAVAVGATALLVAGPRDTRVAELGAELAARERAVAALEQATAWSLRLATLPDAAVVDLTSSDGSPAEGRLIFSPSTRELVVLATGLARPPAGREFRCWVEVDGQRRRVGRMNFAGEAAFWLGPVDTLAGLPAGARFGVTLVDAAGDALDGPATLLGTL